jgi:hypothetical protein
MVMVCERQKVASACGTGCCWEMRLQQPRSSSGSIRGSPQLDECVRACLPAWVIFVVIKQDAERRERKKAVFRDISSRMRVREALS